MTDFAELAVRGDSSDLRTVVDDMRRVGDAGAETEKRTGQSMAALSGSFKTVAVALGALAGAAVSAMSFRAITEEASRTTTQMLRLEHMIGRTGSAAGRSARDMERFAQSLARATLESVDGVLSAQQTLLRFTEIVPENFERVIEAAADMSTEFGSLESNTRNLARALEDPLRGMDMLGRQFPAFRGELGDTIKAMAEMGDTAGAQAAILEEVERTMGGVARVASPLAAAQDSLSQSFRNARLAIDEATGASDRWARAISGVDSMVQGFTGWIESANDALDRIAYYAGAAATIIGVSLGRALVSATALIWAKVAALVGLRTAIARTGLGLLVVGAGELAYRFDILGLRSDRLARDLGTVGEAQRELNEALKQHNERGSPMAASLSVDRAKALNTEASAALAVASAEYEAMRARHASAQALLDQNPLTRGDQSGYFQAFEEEAEKASARIAELQSQIVASDAVIAVLGQTSDDTADSVDILSRGMATASRVAFEQIPGFASLRTEYGSLALEAEKLLKAQQDLAVMDARASLAGVAAEARGLAESLGIAGAEAEVFDRLLSRVGSERSFEEQAQQVAGLAEYVRVASGGIENMDAQTRAVYQSMLDAALGAARLSEQISVAEAGASSLGDMIARLAAVFGPVIEQAQRLAGVLGGVLGQIRAVAGSVPLLRSVGDMLSRITSAPLEGVVDTLRGSFAGAIGNISSLWNSATSSADVFNAELDRMNQGFEAISGGGGGGGRGGGSAGAAADGILGIGEAAQQSQGMMQQFQDTIGQAFVSFVSGAQSARQAAAQLLQSLARLLANRAWTSLMGAFTGGIGGGIGPAPIIRGIFSGGGYTGDGPRSGGLDGQGGFAAIMHPRETVIDHTKGRAGQAMQGSPQQVVVRLDLSADLDARVASQSQGVAVEVVRQYDRALPDRIAQYQRDPMRRG